MRHSHKSSLPRKGPCTCRGAGRQTAGSPPGALPWNCPICRKELRKLRVHCPPGRIQAGLVQTIRKIQGAALTSSPHPQHFLSAQNQTFFREQSMVLTSPGRQGPAWKDGHSSLILSLLGDSAWDCGYKSRRMASAWHLPSSSLCPASRA